MPNYYIYLISTLPTLHFGTKMPFPFEKFIAYSQRFIPESDIEILKKISIAGEYATKTLHPTLQKWQDFDTALRNELVKVRAGKLHLETSKFLRGDGFADTHISHIALNASRNPSILEAEKILDEARWRALEELSFSHYFDLDFLILYGLKLMLLERWERVNTQDKAQVLEDALKLN